MDSNLKWKKFAAEKGIPDNYAETPLDRFFIKVGIKVRPFLFWNIFVILLFSGFFLFFIVACLIFFPQLFLKGQFDRDGLFYSVCAGVIFGIYAPIHIYLVRRKMKLPSWSTFKD